MLLSKKLKINHKEKISLNQIFHKEFMFKIYEEFLKLNNKTTNYGKNVR